MKKIIMIIFLIVFFTSSYAKQTPVYKIVRNKLILVGYILDNGKFIRIRK